jgi:hypothetical protein
LYTIPFAAQPHKRQADGVSACQITAQRPKQAGRGARLCRAFRDEKKNKEKQLDKATWRSGYAAVCKTTEFNKKINVHLEDIEEFKLLDVNSFARVSSYRAISVRRSDP